MENEKPMVGGALAHRIREAQEKRGFNLGELAGLLGMSKPYLTAILSGDRPIDRLNSHYLDAIASFLSIPKAQVYNLAEILLPEDFVIKENIDDTLDEIHRRIKYDTFWMHLVPPYDEWKTMPIKTKLLIAYMYETIAHEKIIQGITTYKFVDQ